MRVANYFPSAQQRRSRTCVHACARSCTINKTHQTIFPPVTQRYPPPLHGRVTFFSSSPPFLPDSASGMPNPGPSPPKKIPGIAKAEGRAFSISAVFPPPPSRSPPSTVIYQGVTLYAPRHCILIFQDSMILASTRPAVLNFNR